jgi:hypothetical protein
MITAGKTKQEASGIVFVVYGVIDYEGKDTIAVTTSRKLANLAISSDETLRKVYYRFPYDSYSVRRFKLDTAEYITAFNTVKKVRSL